MTDLIALLDAFALAAPRFASMQLPTSDVLADALLHWSIERGHGAETHVLERDGRRWKCITVYLPNRAWVCAHREREPVEQQSAEVANG